MSILTTNIFKYYTKPLYDLPHVTLPLLRGHFCGHNRNIYMNILFIHLFILPKPIFPDEEVFCYITLYFYWSCISTEKL